MSIDIPTSMPGMSDMMNNIADYSNKLGDEAQKYIDKYTTQVMTYMQNSMTPGENNPQYQSALDAWKSKNPDAAAQFDKNANDPKKKKDVINNLQMAINRGEITKQQASQLLTQGPAAHEYDFTSKGHTGTSAGAYAIANQTGGALDGDSSDPKKAGREYDAAQVFSLGGLLPNPVSTLLDPTVSHSFGSVMGSGLNLLNPGGSILHNLM
ncbi:hypothetical protein [Paraburkholderia sp. SOS3]|jgi:hypothetical protein|uniref:hypothetical protein n=1 Tax=Paraburkholderia sp. SOS3 TaxID=1926494 RepID=UPI0012ECB6B3|nr:hypothetical protein [Paraburkholderia sp. SOS3]